MGKARRLAEDFIDLVNRETGLLQERGHRRYGFLHLTFEEYLAARALLESVVVKDADAEIHHRASDPGWREVLRLALASVSQKEAQRLLLHLLAAPTDEKDRGRPVVLAGECLQDIGRNGATQRAWRAVTAALLGALTDPQVPLLTRVDAGHVLGRLGDPRLLDLKTGEAAGHSDYDDVPSYWCLADQGPFWFGDERVKDETDKTQRNEDGTPQRDLTKLKQIVLPYSFKIARYPVTNAEFAAFLEANGSDGYDNTQPWWTEEGKKYLFPDGQPRYTEPNYWNNAQFNSPAQPVVGVSWYEAAAYCRWLSAIGWERGWLPQDQEIRLPTSLEWERAARHTGPPRSFPWGEATPTPEQANYDKTGLGSTSPVGCFLHDQAVCGALDVVGNVAEWTSTDSMQIEEIYARKDFTVGDGADLRSGSWGEDLEWMCCGARGRYNPDIRSGDCSFRVVQSLRAH
ncbi:SUMF1/EgtB/PvdO family nonheme iron enzyme [Oscillochloris sp. ZM17-4]|nr:SUMF1/EgtB/PvdO family nonheme iron enzyme [Oscillochloris sp. ZM17-4]